MKYDLLIGTYTQPEGHVPEGSGEGIYYLSINKSKDETQATGTATLVIKDKRNPTFLATASSTDETIAVTHEVGPNGVLSFWKRDTFSKISEIETKMRSSPVHVITRNSITIVSHYVSGVVQVYNSNTQQLVYEISSDVLGPPSLINKDRQESPHPHSCMFLGSSSSEFVIADLGTDKLTFVTNFKISYSVIMPPGSGPRHMTLHPTNPNVFFVLNELSCSVSILERSSADTQFKIKSTTELGSEKAALAAHLKMAFDGKYLFCSIRNEAKEGQIVTLEYNSNAALLTVRFITPSGGICPRHFIILNNDLLVAANQDSHNIVIFTIITDNTTGMMRLQQELPVISCRSPVCLLQI